MKLQYVHWDNFRFLTGLGKSFASTVDAILREFDEGSGGQITKLMLAINSPISITVNIPPGSLVIQYDEETCEYGRCFESFLGEKYSEALQQGNERYGGGMPWTLTLIIKRGDRRAIIDIPLASALRTQRDYSVLYQVYSHSYIHDENGESLGDGNAYIGVTKRGWRTRWAEHVRSAERGSRYRFHQAIRHFGDNAQTVLHNVIACGQTEAEAMALEEQMVGLETLYPKGLNMIPGGYAGLKYLRQIGAVGTNERVTPDDKQEIVNRFFETASRRGLPNPLAAANWCDPSYAEKVICAGDDRLKPDQIRNARFLASLGRSTDDIVAQIGARAISHKCSAFYLDRLTPALHNMVTPRPSAQARGYGAAWAKARKGYLKSHPHCVMCARLGHQVAATVVDHIRRHGGDQALFWAKDNWQGLCGPHHNSTKQRDESRGYASGCDAAGRPIDPQHPWNNPAPHPPSVS